MSAPPPDADGLLASLVIAPGTFPRNRFFTMFRSPALAKARGRAAELRSIVRTLLGHQGEATVESRVDGDDGVRLVVRVPKLSLTVTTQLTPFERDVVDVAVSIGRQVPAPPEAKERVETALARLAPRLVGG